jgi:hypothetical protein
MTNQIPFFQRSLVVTFTKRRAQAAMSSIAKPETQSKGLPRKQSVKFNERVRSREALHINDYTEEEIQATWYSFEEILAIRKACVQTAMLVKLSGQNILENAWFSSRGIESMLNKNVVRQRRVDAWNAILGEQQRQFIEEDYKPRIIANLYREIAVIALKEARSRGIYDDPRSKFNRTEICKGQNVIEDHSFRAGEKH